MGSLGGEHLIVSLRKASVAAVTAISVAVSGAASAALVLVSEPPQTVGPQSTSAPCIIAGTTCQNPVGFDFTNFNQNGGTPSYTESSPIYSVSQFSGLFGTPVFNVAIDVNTTNAQGETLDYFRVYVDADGAEPGGFALFTSYEDDGNIGSISGNGNGYADWTLRSVDLTGFGPNALVRFDVKFDNASDGAESFFVVAVPEPSTWAMLLAGLGMLGFMARRRLSS
jgi:hypothetical protein